MSTHWRGAAGERTPRRPTWRPPARAGHRRHAPDPRGGEGQARQVRTPARIPGESVPQRGAPPAGGRRRCSSDEKGPRRGSHGEGGGGGAVQWCGRGCGDSFLSLRLSRRSAHRRGAAPARAGTSSGCERSNRRKQASVVGAGAARARPGPSVQRHGRVPAVGAATHRLGLASTVGTVVGRERRTPSCHKPHQRKGNADEAIGISEQSDLDRGSGAVKWLLLCWHSVSRSYVDGLRGPCIELR